MPLLPTHGRGAEVQILPETVWTVMAFPRDESERKRYLARFWESEVAEVEEPLRSVLEIQPHELSRELGKMLGAMLLPVGGFSTLGDAPGFSELQERLLKRLWPGQIAGETLLNLLQLDAANAKASVNKAVPLVARILREDVKTKSGEEGGKSERYIRKAWEDFKPACHLWAAYRWWLIEERQPGPFEAIDGLLMVSEALLALASRLQGQGRREKLLRMEEMWRVPRRYPLPKLKGLPVPPLEDWQHEILRSYKAPKRD